VIVEKKEEVKPKINYGEARRKVEMTLEQV